MHATWFNKFLICDLVGCIYLPLLASYDGNLLLYNTFRKIKHEHWIWPPDKHWSKYGGKHLTTVITTSVAVLQQCSRKGFSSKSCAQITCVYQVAHVLHKHISIFWLFIFWNGCNFHSRTIWTWLVFAALRAFIFSRYIVVRTIGTPHIMYNPCHVRILSYLITKEICN